MNAFQHYAAQLERSPIRIDNTGFEETPAQIRERITLRLLSKGPAKMQDVADELGCDRRKASEVLCSLVAKKLVEKVPACGQVKSWRLA